MINFTFFQAVLLLPWFTQSFHVTLAPNFKSMPLTQRLSSPDKHLKPGHHETMHMSTGLVDIVQEPIPVSKSPERSSFTTVATNLVKNCVGAGVFSITYKMISISPDSATAVKATALIAVMAVWAAYNFWIIGETCAMTNSTTYAEAWTKTVSEKSKWIIQATVLISPIVSCLANTIVLTDILKSILISFGFPMWLSANRNFVILLLGSTILFPLCSLKDLSALQSVSVFGLAGQLLSMSILFVRYLDKSYFPGGKFCVNAIARGATGAAMTSVSTKAAELASATAVTVANSTPIDPMKWFVFASLLSYCFVTHYNAPRFYNELKDASSESFLKLSMTSFLIAGTVYIGTMLLGLALFGANAKSFLMNNLLSSDPLALVARAAFGASVLASTPLIFLSMRNWYSKKLSLLSNFFSDVRPVTAILLSVICGLAVRFSDIGVVGSVSGGIFGSSMMFIFPPIMYIRALQKRALANGTTTPKIVVAINIALLLCGATLATLGTYNSVGAILPKRI